MPYRYYLAGIQDTLYMGNINKVANNVFVEIATVDDLDIGTFPQNVNLVFSLEDWTAYRRVAPGVGKDKWETTGALSA